MRLTHSAIADDQYVIPTFDGIHRLRAQRSQLGFNAFITPHQGVSDVQCAAAEFAVGMLFNIAQLGHISKIQHRLAHF